ncbi:MAG TPA: PTS sugar transporter subunit IIA [Planctomycetota bacterium]|jgi:mannitol/fructose-specific phosphotransferase system IIA component (Ntr-type)|nr:PTS sugar transporter subunit IIA [Planctomycetota bacterium]OQC21346.1 MAG: PTS system fructose-specific EIIABC component [Planctomycetes bacterium ADurb.Bin069]NMD36123.1 PTS sugar transporter subunit IIA [Planctomycetota bacterium]HNR99677.1 PTS sugar transporter subunit IIA [Planctomycetota bacterium]HNU25195.1 PTS sugar transporter subunit IIA [Planctomycetota bacterium]
MHLRRYLRPESVRLELNTQPPDPEVELTSGIKRRLTESVFGEIVELLSATGQVCNERKLLTDLLNREKKAGMALEGGVAIPHVRTMQARSFVIALARSTPGLPFGAPDGDVSRIFVGLVAPPYDDRLYLRIYRTLAPLLMDPDWKNELLAARDVHEVLRLCEGVCR